MRSSESTAPSTPLRVKLGPNPYANRFTCAYCRSAFESGGFYLRLEQQGKVVDMPLCAPCAQAGKLYETIVTFDDHDASHPVALA